MSLATRLGDANVNYLYSSDWETHSGSERLLFIRDTVAAD